MTLDFNTAAPQAGPSQIPPTWAKTTYNREEVLAAIKPQLEGVLGYLYPQGHADPKGQAFFVGDVTGSAGESLNIVLRGERAGLWHDFATGEGGDIFDLWAAARGLNNFRDTLQDMGDYSGATANTPRRPPKRKATKGGDAWGVPSATYNYTDANGSIIAQVDRFEWTDDTGRKRKTFRPWDAKAHKYQAPETRPLYNLAEVARSPELILVEGEKCADALMGQNISATTAMGGSNAPIEATDWTPLEGRKVLIWPDNDDTGRKYAEQAKAAILAAGALSCTVLRIPANVPPKWDAADAAEAGEDLASIIRTMRGTTAEAERNGTPNLAPFQSWALTDARTLPARQFLYGNHYIRKFASVTVAPGGLGKSTLVLAECIAMATGRDILGIRPSGLCKVVYFNAEDPFDEIQRRVLAICQHHEINQAELVGQLFVASGRDQELILSKGDDGAIIEATFELMERYAQAENIDIFAFDPLANMTEAPETNDAFRRLGKRLSLMADRLNCSIELVHHTRKLNGNEASVEDSRGGSALIGAVRAGRALNPMTADEAAKAGIESHIDYFRIEAAGKNNLSRSAPHSTWYQRVGVDLANGDQVASIEPWQWPDAFDGVSASDARKVRDAIGAMTHAPRESAQSPEWGGHVVANILGMDGHEEADKAKIKTMIKHWVKIGVLKIEKRQLPRKTNPVPFLVAGPNALSEVP
jgi:putative DNA primase/helicase